MREADEVPRERHQAGAASQRRLSRELRPNESPPTAESGQFALAQWAGRPGASFEIPASRVARLGTMGMETFGRSADILGLRRRNWRWRSLRGAREFPARPSGVRPPQKAQVLPPRHSWLLAHAVPMTAGKRARRLQPAVTPWSGLAAIELEAPGQCQQGTSIFPVAVPCQAHSPSSRRRAAGSSKAAVLTCLLAFRRRGLWPCSPGRGSGTQPVARRA